MTKYLRIIEIVTLMYLMLANIVSFCMYGIDKWKARRNKWRIKEKTLILLAFVGGALGAFTGMFLFHHKTKHTKFIIMIPLALILWAVITVLIFVYL